MILINNNYIGLSVYPTGFDISIGIPLIAIGIDFKLNLSFCYKLFSVKELDMGILGKWWELQLLKIFCWTVFPNIEIQLTRKGARELNEMKNRRK